MLAVPHLAAAIRDHRREVDEALRALTEGEGAAYNLDAIEVLAELMGRDTATLLVALLDKTQQSEALAAALRARQIAISDADLAAFPATAPIASTFAPVLEPGMDLDALGRFAAHAKAFRCRILIDGQIKGSGAIVAPRLVLTAWHVIADAEGRRLEVQAEDGRRYPGCKVWHSPCHDDEHLGRLPPPEAADTHFDAALIRLFHPVGRRLAEMSLPDHLDPDWTGTRHLFLIHYPDGNDTGGAPGQVVRNQGDLRLVHNIATSPGSSGGPGFDRQLRFVGLHQGRADGGANRRLVPLDRLDADPGFRKAIDEDRAVPSLWSLDETGGGHLILGRSLYLDAIRAMALHELPMIGGIWIRRADMRQMTGLSFSHTILTAYLHALGRQADVTLVPTEHAAGDLIAHIDGLLAAGDGGAPEAGDGLRPIETSTADEDEDADRAGALIGRLRQRAAAGRSQWLFFENPPEGLGRRVQVQLQQIVRQSLATPDVNVVIAGFETYDLAHPLFEALDAAQISARPGLLAEFLTDTPVDEIRAVLNLACHDLRLNWPPDVICFQLDRALSGLPRPNNTLPREHLETVAVRLKALLRPGDGP